MERKINYFVLVLLVLVVSCQDNDGPGRQDIELLYTFGENEEGWIGDFADLPADGQEIFELEVDHAQLPEETGSAENAIRIQGHNRSDDLFMFLKRKVTGLRPMTSYHMVMEIELASQYPEESFGIGGSPGGSVYLKAGASAEEPMPILEGDYLVMNIDKGNQSQEGSDMINIGTIGIEGEEFRYELISRGNSDRPFMITTDGEGSIWLIVGTDSGFEGLTELYYNTIKVRLDEIVLLPPD